MISVKVGSLLLPVLLAFSPVLVGPGNDSMTYYDLYRSAGDGEDKYVFLEKYLSGRSRDGLSAEDARLCYELANHYAYDLFLYSRADYWFRRCETAYASLKLPEELARSRYAIALCNYRLDSLHTSFRYVSKALDYFTTGRDTSEIIRAYTLLGSLYMSCGDTLTSKEYMLRSLYLSEKICDSASVSTAFMNLLAVTPKEDSLVLRDYTEKAAVYSRGLDDSTKLCHVFLNACGMALNSGRNEEAELYLAKSKPYVNDILEYGRYYLSESVLEASRGNISRAEESLDMAVGYFSKGELFQELTDTYSVEHHLYAEAGDYRKAYDALSRLMEINARKPSGEVYLELHRTICELEARDRPEYGIVFWALAFIAALSFSFNVYSFFIKKNKPKT